MTKRVQANERARILAAIAALEKMVTDALVVDDGERVCSPAARRRRPSPRCAPKPITDPYERAIANERIANLIAAHRGSR